MERTTGLSHHIISARESEEVALLWIHNIAGAPAPDEWEGDAAYGIHNDLYLIESQDGQDWDLNRPFNVTRTLLPDPRHRFAGDTLRPYNDVDAIYVGDVLHAVFSTRGFWMTDDGEGEPPVEDFTTKKSHIWHWDSETDTLTLVADGWYDNDGEPGNMHSNVSRPSLGLDEDGTLYCLFRQVTEDDRNDDDYCFGELMLSKSDNEGITWSESILLTGTVSGGDNEYVDEHHPSLAERVDDNLHISYMLADDGFTEVSQMIYQRIAVEDLPDVDDLEMPREDFQYHQSEIPIEVKPRADAVPLKFGIEEIFPNPFNSQALITYNLRSAGEVKISVIDIYGRTLDVLDQGMKTLGQHELIWDGSVVVSGTYFVNLYASGVNISQKVVLLK